MIHIELVANLPLLRLLGWLVGRDDDAAQGVIQFGALASDILGIGVAYLLTWTTALGRNRRGRPAGLDSVPQGQATGHATASTRAIRSPSWLIPLAATPAAASFESFLLSAAAALERHGRFERVANMTALSV